MNYYKRAVTGRENYIRLEMQRQRKAFLESVVIKIINNGKAYFYENRFIEDGLRGCTLALLKKWATDENFTVDDFRGGIIVTT